MLTLQILSLRCCSIKGFPFGIVREALRCPCLPRVFRMAKGSQVVVVLTSNPSTWEAEEGEPPRVQGQAELQLQKSSRRIRKPCLEKKGGRGLFTLEWQK